MRLDRIMIKPYLGPPMRECVAKVRKLSIAESKHFKSTCSRHTNYFINGKPYCRMHAGEYCLQRTLENNINAIYGTFGAKPHDNS